jgi:O-antigen/teichoic acid export membrane protein
MRQLAVRGAGATVLSAGAGLVVQVGATMILARLLTPRDFGLVTMVTTFSLLFMNFGLNGFTEAVLQREELDHRLASNLFWINLSMGLGLTLAFAAAGSLLARFYGNPLVTPVAVAMSLTILLTSTSVLHLALLKRAMLFSLTSALDVISAAVSLVLAILLARAGWSYWALVAGALCTPLVQSLGAWSLCRWIPGWPRRVGGTASVVRFAMSVYGRFGVNYGARNLDNLLVGWRFDAVSLGFYKKAYDLFALSAGQLVAPLTNVAVSALSRLQSDSERYKKYLLSALGVMAFVGMGLGADLTLVGKDVIRVLLGPGWGTAGRIFTFFGPGIGIMFLYYTHGWIHLSIGRANRWLYWGIVEFIFTGLLFVAALPWGPVGVAAAWTLSFWILTIPAFSYAGKPIQLGVGSVLAAVWRYTFASLLAGCVSLAILRALPPFGQPNSFGALEHIVVTSLLFGAFYLGAVVGLHWSAMPLYEVVGLLREMSPWHKSPEMPANGSDVADEAWESLSGTVAAARQTGVQWPDTETVERLD